ncbi:hypothetical protein [Streptomyces sp. NPDC048560]|uniref:hypothetical protein n=1 Tax=Streptomyces sp. NPDC048560 TaxID=3155488 RepID=UPI003430CE60
MSEIVGQAGVDIVPYTRDFHARLKAAVLPSADRVGRDIGERMGQAISASLVVAIPQAINRGGRAGVAAAGRQGDDAGGAFSRSLKRKLEIAFKAMPKLQVGLSDTGVDAELARLRSKLEQLSNKRIGIDVDAGAARAEVLRIEEQLRRLGAEHPNVQVRADTAAARAALIAIREEIDSVDRKDIRIPVRVDTSQATSALMSLTLQIGAAMAIPLGPTLAAGLGAVVAMSAAAGAGVGALALAAIPAIKGVTEALSAKSAAEREASTATDQGTASTSKAASKALQMAGAQAALSAAHRNAAQSIVSGNRAIEDAERAVAQAVQRAADQRRQSADAIRRAEQSLADSHRRVRDAQESLTDANESAEEAEQGLTRARQDAARALKDLNDQLTNGALDQREAALLVREAKEELERATAGYNVGTVSQLDFDQAQLAYDQAIQGQKEQNQGYKDLQKSAEEQQKAGIEGSDAVKDAADRVADAQEAVREQLEAVTDAQRAVRDSAIAVADAQSQAARDQREAAESVANAQRGVADAVQNAANAQVSAAESIASAERGVASARLSGIDTTTKAITKSDEYQKALAKLSAPQRDLFDAIAGPKGLKTAFSEWQKTLQPEVLPLFTRGVDGAKASLPGLTPLVLGAAAGIQSLQDKASAQLKTPFWVSFKADLAENVQPAVEGFGVAFGNVIKGIAGIIDAFLPHMDGIADHSDRITERFANWGTSLKGSPDFERFLAYVKDTSPGVAKFIGDVLTAALDVSKAVSPMAMTVLAVVGPVFEAISWLATNSPGLVQALWGIFFAQKAIALGMVAFSAAMAVYQSVILLSTIATAGFGTVLTATGIGPIIRAIVLVVGLLIAGFVLAYNNSETFRKVVDGAWSGIKETIGFVWNSVLKPAFAGIWEGMKAIGAAAAWLWDVVGPVFGFLYEGAKILVTTLITLFLLPAYLAFKALGKIGKWLWDSALGPIFGWIGEKAIWVYDKAIKPAMKEAVKTFEDLGAAGKWLWDRVLKPIFGWIGEKAAWLYEKGIKPHFGKISKAVDLVAASFGHGKDSIKAAWDQIEKIAKKPIKFIIDHVYNKGIVPLWNAVSKITGVDKLKKMELEGFATGGILSGYSPGVDDRVIAVGGGEAILRPEVTRAVGAGPINAWNAAARSGGVGAVQKAISNGMPAFADGGIVGSIWGGLKSAGSSVANGIKDTADFLTNPEKVFNAATGWAKSQMKQFASSKWGQMVTEIPIGLLKSLKDSIFGGGDGTGTAATGSVGRALSFARAQDGKPYQWGGAYNPSFDCSGLMSSIQKVITGQNPRGRLWSTFSFNGDTAPAGWVRNLRSPFMIGITNDGVGHTAGTLAGVNVESRGGDGVVIGSRARGWNNSLFTSRYGFAPAAKANGYAAGGFPQLGETAWVGEKGPELLQFMTPTRVHSSRDSMAMARQAQNVSGASSGQAPAVPHVIVKNYIDGQEVGGFVDTKIEMYDAETGRALDVGRIL